jgi:hypothetical protein
MTWALEIPDRLYDRMLAHLFNDGVEQGAFLYAEPQGGSLIAREVYLVPPSGWEIQSAYRLVMKDDERARILARARQSGLCLVDCHSHPGSGEDIEFSPSDYSGVVDFAQYVKWKLDGRPYAALVWGEASVDGVVWERDFARAMTLDAVRVINGVLHVRPRATWESVSTWSMD